MPGESKNLTPERIEELRVILRDGKRRAKLDAMHEAAIAHASAAPLVPDIAVFMTSEDYVPVEEQDYSFSGHSPLSWAAMGSIESIGVAPDLATLRKLLDSRTVMILPEASYDQGAYIGDYSSESIAPAALAARLVPLMREDGFVLLPELLWNAQQEEKLIWESAILAIKKLLPFLPDTAEYHREHLNAWAIAVSVSAEGRKPTSWRTSELRDLAALCQKKLKALG